MTAGPDGITRTDDDLLALLSDIGGTNTVTMIPVPRVHDDEAGGPVVLSPTLAVIGTRGPDGLNKTADDTVVVVSGIGTTNTVTQVTVSAIDDDGASRCIPLGPTTCAFAGFGADEDDDTPDDNIVVLSGIGTTNTVTVIPVPGLEDGGASQVVRFSSTSLLVASGGPDGDFHIGPDVISIITGIGSTPVVQTLPAVHFDSRRDVSHRPMLLGNGRAVFISAGLDTFMGTGSDDQIRLITGLGLPPFIPMLTLWPLVALGGLLVAALGWRAFQSDSRG